MVLVVGPVEDRSDAEEMEFPIAYKEVFQNPRFLGTYPRAESIAQKFVQARQEGVMHSRNSSAAQMSDMPTVVVWQPCRRDHL